MRNDNPPLKMKKMIKKIAQTEEIAHNSKSSSMMRSFASPILERLRLRAATFGLMRITPF